MNKSTTHIVTDAATGAKLRLIVELDNHGMAIELPNQQWVILDLSNGQMSVYHHEDDGRVEKKILSIEVVRESRMRLPPNRNLGHFEPRGFRDGACGDD